MDVEDDLELFEEYDLEHDSDDSRSDGERGGAGRRHNDDDEEDIPQTPAQVEAAIQEVKGTVVEVVSALGGLEDVEVNGNIETVYVLGDDCLRCLRDLRRLWREGADDPNRVIAHVFSQVGVLQNLLPLLLKTAGGDERAQKISLACVDLLTSITWPVDARAEMRAAKERGEDASQLAHLVSLEQSMVAYKAAVLRIRLGETRADTNRDALSCIMRYILLPSLSKHRSQRSERDVGTIAMSLHLFRNLLAIRDPMATTLSSAEEIAESTLQSDLVVAMARTHILETLLMLANGADKGEFNQWNVVTADCIYAVYGGQRAGGILAPTPSSSSSSTSAPSAPSSNSTTLSTYLAAEALQRRTTTPSSRHSRFGTTLSFYTPDGSRRVARTQTALRKSVDELRRENDAKSRRKFRRRTKANEAGAPRIHAEWTKEAKKALQDWADRFLLSNGFQVLTRSVLKDIAMEREKVGDLDEARVKVMLLAAFFLDWFRERRANDPGQWSFAFLDEWLKEWSFKMVLVRSIDSLESKHWLELSAAVQLWMSLLRIIEDMSRQGDEVAKEAAEHLLANHFYHAETLKVCLSIGRCYTTQSMEFLDTVVSFLNVMPRLLERYAQDKDHLYVRAKKAARAQRKLQDSTAPHDSEDEADADHAAHHAATTLYTERKLSFSKFQSHLATRPLVEACIGYLSKWRDFTRPAEQLGNVVAVLHRIAIKAGDVRAFFPVHIRNALQVVDKGEIYTALQPVAPRATEDCKKLVHYCLRRFEKLDTEEKALWSLGQKPPKPAKKVKMPREIAAKPGFTRDEAVGIAVGLLAEQGAIARVAWVSSALELASEERTDLVRQVDGPMWEEALRPDCGGDEDALRVAVDEVLLRERPSDDAISQFSPWHLDYGTNNPDLQRDATTLPALKMLCRLVGLESDEDDEECWKWRVARDALPGELRVDAELIGRYLERPFELPYGAERFEDLVQAVRRKATRPAAAGVAVRGQQQHGEEVSDSDSSSSSSAASSSDEDLGGTRKRGRGHRRRKDLVGDKRKTKGYRRKPPPASFLNDDVIDSDEEDQVERLWREANGGGGGGRAGSSAASSPARQSRSHSPAVRRNRSRSRSGSSSASSTPPTSSPARRDAVSSSTRKAPPPSKRRSSALFFESDADDSDEEPPAAASPTRARISPSPSRSASASPLLARKRKAAAAVLSSDDEEESEDEDELPPLILTGRTAQVTQPMREDSEEEEQEGGASKVAAAAARPARRALVGSDSDDDDYDQATR